MDWATAALGFSGMGNEARLQILRALVRSGHDGLTVGALQEQLGIAPSTLAHHLRAMVDAGLIAQEKQGRMVHNTAQFDHLEKLAHFILCECCHDGGEIRNDE